MSQHAQQPQRRRRFAPILIAAGIAGTALLSLSMTGTLSAFVSAITNTNDTVAAGAVVLQESNGAVNCLPTDVTTSGPFACATINKYGGNTTLVPGGVSTPVTVSFKNLGTGAAATFTAKFGACTVTNNGAYQGGATAAAFCSKLNIAVYTGATATGPTVIAGTATGLATAPASTLTVPAAASGTTVTYTFQVTLDSTADNTLQGYQASQPITWTLSS